MKERKKKMREIKFRGQRQSDNKWIYGDLLQPTEMCNIYEISDCESIDGSRYDVIKHTIGQYTGLKDKNGKEIYEGDIVRIDKEDYKYIVKFYDGCFVGVSIYDEHYEQAKILGNLFTLEIEVIGNIYDNPKLLENKQDKE